MLSLIVSGSWKMTSFLTPLSAIVPNSQCHLSLQSVFFYDGNKILYSKRNSRWSIEFLSFTSLLPNEPLPPFLNQTNQQNKWKICVYFSICYIKYISLSLLRWIFQVYLIEHFIKLNQQQKCTTNNNPSEKIRLCSKRKEKHLNILWYHSLNKSFSLE